MRVLFLHTFFSSFIFLQLLCTNMKKVAVQPSLQWTHPQAPRARRSQPETQNAIFSADFLSHTLVSQTMARHTLTQCGFVVFGSVALTQENGCMGAYRVIDLEQFPVRISTDKTPTPLTKFGICSFFFFFFCHSFLSFSVWLCQIHGVLVRFSLDDPCFHNNNK